MEPEVRKVMGIGVGVIILNANNQILLGRRNDNEKKASSKLKGAGTWTMPGGKVDFGEQIHETAKRETKEETNISVLDLELIAVNEDMSDNVHFLTIGFLARQWSGDLKTMEPEVITEWRWFSLNELPENLYFPSKKLLNNYRQKQIFIRNNE